MAGTIDIALQSILDCVGWRDPPADALRPQRTETALATDFPIADLAMAALSAVALAVIEIHRRRGGPDQTASIDRRAASLAMAAADFLRIDGEKARFWDPISGFYAARDGWAFLHGNFPHLRDGLLEVFGSPNDRGALAGILAGRDALDIEDAAGAHNLCAVALRCRAEWDGFEQGRAIAALPLVGFRRIGDAPAEPWEAGERPLSGVRVLDLTRVIAGPMAGRTLAEHGATVMRISGPNLPHVPSLVVDTGFGKLSAFVDLDEAAGRARLAELAREADVFVSAYRPGSLAARGFAPDDIARLRPGIVCVTLSAFSAAGPWAGRRGYDSLVQAATGLARLQDGGPPERLPCQPLDYLTGYLAAFGAMAGLMRRAADGGSWHVEVSLARSARWIWEMTDALGTEAGAPAANPEPEDLGALMMEADSAFGALRALRPAIVLSKTPGAFVRPPVPLGSDSPSWP